MTLARSAAAVVAVAAVWIGACSSSTECDCPDPSVQITVPSESAAAVQTVTVSGAACATSKVNCIQPGASGACARWSVTPTAEGTCHVEVTFATGVFAADVAIRAGSGCCAQLVPEGSGTVAASPPPAGEGADAGDGG